MLSKVGVFLERAVKLVILGQAREAYLGKYPKLMLVGHVLQNYSNVAGEQLIRKVIRKLQSIPG